MTIYNLNPTALLTPCVCILVLIARPNLKYYLIIVILKRKTSIIVISGEQKYYLLNETMSNGFVHSIKVPRLYKTTAKIVQKVAEDGASLKQLIYEKKHPNLASCYALAVTTLKNGSLLDELLRKSRILLEEKRLDAWLARVLIAELLWGKKVLKSEAKPLQTVLSYREKLLELSKNLEVPTSDQQVKKPRYVRVNTLVANVEEIIQSFKDDEWMLLPKCPEYTSFLNTLGKLNGNSFIQDFHVPELLAFPCGTQFHNDPRYKDGAIILQDKASCFPAFLLNPKPGSTALDMCAAPGMKTTHLAAIMKNQGKIFAIEKDKRRYETLCKLVEDSNATCVTTFNADSMTMDVNKCPNVEYILVDPSCSGSGMSDRMNLDGNSSKSAPGRLRSLQSFQVLLLRHALLNFPTVKRVVYSTCSMYPEENEMVVDEILSDIGDSYKLKSVKKLLGGNWNNFSSEEYACKQKCLYARPETDYSNGFFVAVFERSSDVPLPAYIRKSKKAFAKQEKPRDFVDENESTKSLKNDQKNVIESESFDSSKEKKSKKKGKRRKTEGHEFGNLARTESDCEIKVEHFDVNIPKKKKKKDIEAKEMLENTENLQLDEHVEAKIKEKKKKKKTRSNSTT
ncbi:28S rRNA (cytosine-C(5))-methyltransferase [Venturia canescens]|uniref:28S rRNA (cytosine-C(5))-methyltransferase n=1 Tax=Venturia canescens TaxID=32260 RepID=UPI001C9C5320|nr:28S rRNA (cytosine-C(5))-methyltransferase [Venturia canescens]